MPKILVAEINVTKRRIGRVIIKHEGLTVCCEICLYKNQKLWVKMPEIHITKRAKNVKENFETKEISSEKQVIISKKVFDVLDLNLEKAIELKKDFFTTRKELTKQKIKFTLQKTNAET